MRRVIRLARHDEKARHVVGFVLDIGFEDVEAIDFAGERGRDGGERLGPSVSATCVRSLPCRASSAR